MPKGTKCPMRQNALSGQNAQAKLISSSLANGTFPNLEPLIFILESTNVIVIIN